MIQPLFPTDDDNQAPAKQPDENYLLHHGHGRKMQPISKELIARHLEDEPGATPAVDLIRTKLSTIYQQEPGATAELQQAAMPVPVRTKHQQFMYELSTSGKSLAQIQTAWHNYYVALPDEEKHAVWHEFYASNTRQPSAYTQHVTQQGVVAPQMQLPALPSTARTKHEPKHMAVVAEHSMPQVHHSDKRSKSSIKRTILNKVRSRTSEKARARAKRHFHSLLFGLGSGAVMVVLFFFSFFNEMIIAPFIQPSRQVSATPIIVDSDSVAPSETPEVIIPKINVQIPVIYDEPSMEEHAIQGALERGVVHYPTTVLPGQQGNAAVFGHSSNNIFNKGKYKFAFAMLRHLEPGDIFYLTYDKKIYSYRIFAKRIVTPQEVSVLGAVEGKAVTAALITCDPPGTSTNRLVVWGEQISPDPTVAAAPITPPAAETIQPTALAGEGPRLWDRIWSAIF